MTKLWIPEGNEEQTEIDIKIASLDNYINRVTIDIEKFTSRIIELEERSKDLEDWLDSLNKEYKIVSMSEYRSIKSEHLRTSKRLASEKQIYVMAQDTLVGYKKTREDLLTLREKAANKILEFNVNVRSRKRP